MGQNQSTSSSYDCASAPGPPSPRDRLAAGGWWDRDNKNKNNATETPPISGSANGKRGKQPAAGADSPNERVRKLSIVSNRNIQLLSMKPRSERDNLADGLRARRRSSLINLILGAPSSGPRFSDDLCSLGSHMSFGIDYFPDAAGLQPARAATQSTNSSLVCFEEGRASRSRNSQQLHRDQAQARRLPQVTDTFVSGHRRRRSSLSSLASALEADHVWNVEAAASPAKTSAVVADGCQADSYSADLRARTGNSPAALQQSEPTASRAPRRQLGARRCPSLSSIFMASIDLTNPSDEQPQSKQQQQQPSQSSISGTSPNDLIDGVSDDERATAAAGTSPESDLGVADRARIVAERARINQLVPATGAPVRMLHRSGSELLLYSGGSISSISAGSPQGHSYQAREKAQLSTFQSGRPAVPHLSSRPPSATTGCCGVHDRSSFGSFRRMSSRQSGQKEDSSQSASLARETKLIIMLQVCLPFILAGFGNMGAGLVLNKLAHWHSFQQVPIFFVLLPSFVGMKGNIEMTLASRLSTLANLNLLTNGHQRRHAYLSNLILILSQAIGLSLFAVIASTLCEFFTSKLEVSFAQTIQIASLVVLPCALITAVVLVFMSSMVMWGSIWLANLIQVNPDNLSTLLAAMYGDVSCVLTYGMFAELMHSFRQENVLIWPLIIICIALGSWPLLWYVAYKHSETRELSLSSMPPMLTGIVVSLGSGTVLSLVVGRYSRIALYQPVVNGFGANLIAVQASRVSTWLWCSALRRLSATSANSTLDMLDCNKQQPAKLTSASSRLFNMTGMLTHKEKMPDVGTAFAPGDAEEKADREKWAQFVSIYQLIASQVSRGLGLVLKAVRVMLWSFVNPSPNSVAARLLLIMLVPAHTLYFLVIWMLSPDYVLLTWPFYAVYMALCLTQVFVLLLICEPLMTVLMRRHLDPDIFGISILMALADLVGTLCLTGAFWLLARIGDPNAF